MPAQDSLQRFLFEQGNIRGEHVVLAESYQKILSLYAYPEPIAKLLGQALCSVAMITAMLKFEGRISLQLQHGSAISLLFVEANHHGDLRGLVHFHPEASLDDFQDMVRCGVMSVNLMPEKGKQYQGVISLEKQDLASCLTQYFKQSEQLDTEFWLCTQNNAAAGLMLQKLPQEHPDPELWNELQILTQTVKPNEMIELSSEVLLKRLYAEHDLQLFEVKTPHFKCQCSNERALNSILMIPQKELTQLLKEQPTLESDCEFCRAHYQFTADEIYQALLDPDTNSDNSSNTTH